MCVYVFLSNGNITAKLMEIVYIILYIYNSLLWLSYVRIFLVWNPWMNFGFGGAMEQGLPRGTEGAQSSG